MSPGESKYSARGYERIVLALLFSATAINYLDRQALSVVAPVLEKQISLSSIDYSHVIFVISSRIHHQPGARGTVDR